MNLTTFNITPEILRLIAEIDEFKGSWKKLGSHSPEYLKVLRRVATMGKTLGRYQNFHKDFETCRKTSVFRQGE